jgi:hypothetical protein
MLFMDCMVWFGLVWFCFVFQLEREWWIQVADQVGVHEHQGQGPAFHAQGAFIQEATSNRTSHGRTAGGQSESCQCSIRVIMLFTTLRTA